MAFVLEFFVKYAIVTNTLQAQYTFWMFYSRCSQSVIKGSRKCSPALLSLRRLTARLEVDTIVFYTPVVSTTATVFKILC